MAERTPVPEDFSSLFTTGPQGWSRLGEVVDELVDAARAGATTRPFSGIDAEELRRAIDAIDPCPADGVPVHVLAKELTDAVFAQLVDVTSPRTIAHLHCPTITTSAAAEAVIGAANQSMDSFDQGPAATLVEDRLVRWLGGEFGLPATRSGVLTAGGTASNLLGLALAREHLGRRLGFSVRADGLPPESRDWRIVASANAHFSVDQAAALMGLGHQCVATVATDERGAMRVDALDDVLTDLRRHGHPIVAVVPTAGTTDLGVVDPLHDVARRAHDLGVWLHVDAAVGSAFVLSERLAPLLDGIREADSITADFHKLWWQPIGASALLVRDEASFDLLRVQSDYLDRTEDVEEGVLNLVGRSLDTTRRFDALKILVGLRSTGRRRMAAMLEHLVDQTAAAGARIDAHPDFELLAPVATMCVVFRWNPGGVSEPDLAAANVAAQRRLFDSGAAVIGRTRVGGRVALKFTLVNPLLDDADVEGLLTDISATARRAVAGSAGR